MNEYGTQINFTPHQEYVQRVLSVLASTLSITAGLAAFYLYISMRVKVFRHHLILLLLMADFGKAVVLLWYPARVLDVPSSYNNINFCDVVGFFTSSFIEAADLAVLTLAIHTALLIFTRYSGPEGGLFPYRYWVYGFHVLLPLTLAALAFITYGRRSYVPLVTWCYLPVTPTWARYVLSWGPRYVIIISILSIYLSIYIYVKLEYQKVVKDFKQSQSYLSNPPQASPFGTDPNSELAGHDFTADILGSPDLEMQPQLTDPKLYPDINTPTGSSSKSSKKPQTQSRFRQKSTQISMIVVRSFLAFFSYFPGFSFLAPNRYFISDLTSAQLDPTAAAIRDFQRESMANFQMRRNNIERQIRSIFLYPVAYIFLWMAPFAVHILQYQHQKSHIGIFWISCIAAFMQSFNCVVDTVTFCIREKPWIDRNEKIFTTENKEYLQYQISRALPCVPCPPSYQAALAAGYELDEGVPTGRKDGDREDNSLRHSFSSLPGANKGYKEFGESRQGPEMTFYESLRGAAAGNRASQISFTGARPVFPASIDERHTSTGSGMSDLTDATYPPLSEARPPTTKDAALEPGHTPRNADQLHSTHSNLTASLNTFAARLGHRANQSTASMDSTEMEGLVRHAQPASHTSHTQPSTEPTFHPDLPIAPPVPENPLSRSGSPYANRSRSPSQHVQRVVQKKAAQQGAERSQSPLRNVFSGRKNRAASPLAQDGPGREEPIQNRLSHEGSVQNRSGGEPNPAGSILAKSPSRDPGRRNTTFDEQVFRSTTAQRVKFGKPKRANHTQPGRRKSRKKNDKEDDDDGKEVDILGFLR